MATRTASASEEHMTVARGASGEMRDSSLARRAIVVRFKGEFGIRNGDLIE
jgi:hypothetical protein